MNVEDALQMCSAPSLDFTGGEWCYAANTLAEEVARLREERDALAEAQQFPVETVMSWKKRAESAEAMSALRLYLDPAEIGPDGYPLAWHHGTDVPAGSSRPAIKDLVRERAGHRCERCGHPYLKGQHGNGEWSSCDNHCSHGGPTKPGELTNDFPVAQWRILTVHHLNGVKHDCRWWNLAALCQRCHLTIQSRVLMDRVYPFEHSAWFKPHAAGWYAWAYLGEELSRDETVGRLDELLALERQA